MTTSEDLSVEKQLLEKLIAERAELDQHITFLQKRLGYGKQNLSEPILESPGVSVGKGEFFGMSRSEAAIALLRKVRRTLSTNEICQALEQSGQDMSGKNVLSALYTALSRHPELRKVARNTWGLKEWYPHLKDKKKNGPSVQNVGTPSDQETEGAESEE